MLSNFGFVKVLGFHLFVLIATFTCLYFIGVIEFIPTNSNIVQWDAGWYSSIVSEGYVYKKSIQSNTGFFPLFPFLWKISKLSAIGISILNYGVFILGVLLVKISLPNVKNQTVLLSLSFPSLLFMYVPYSEALFFMSSALFLYGNYIDSKKLKIVAILIMSLTRPTIFFFLPAIIFSELMSSASLKSKLIDMLIYTSVILLGTSVSFYIVGISSGNFFAYSDSQINNWSHVFSLPQFPLTTWRGYRILWLDAFGLWIVLSSLAASIIYFVKTVSSKWKVVYDKNMLLSLSYLSMTFIYVLFFHAKEEKSGLTSILSLNRYVFCSPFFIYLFYYYFSNDKIQINKVLGFGIVFTVALIGFPFYSMIELSYLKSIVFVFGVMMFFIIQVIPRGKNNIALFLMVYGVNVFLQVYLFQSFLKGNWIG